MNLGDLLTRVYYILGDVRSNPKFFLRERVVDLLNEGCRQFRRSVEDEWYRQDIPLVAGQHTYTFPDINVRAQRIAFKDYTMRPRTVQDIVGIDAKWETRTGPNPLDWTTQGLPHNQFRVYPTPTITSTAGISQSGEYGAITSWNDGAYATFSSEYGGITQIVGEPQFNSEYGAITTISQTEVAGLTVWGVVKAATMEGDADEVPLKTIWWKAPLAYCLWQLYEGDGEQHNRVLAGVYKDRFNATVSNAQDRVSSPLPFLVFKLGQRVGRSSSRSFLPFAPETGSGQSIGWPRKGYWS